MTPPPLRVLVTGGTFDKEYHEVEGRLFFKAPRRMRSRRTHQTDTSIRWLP